MFGYIKPYKPELKLKEITKYSNAYCALCDQLKKDYGFTSRFILNYDITFLLLCLDHLDSTDKEKRRIRCPYNPAKVKKVQLSTNALRYSAFINYWLVTEKLFDDYTDDRNCFKSFLRKFLVSTGRFKKSKHIYAEKVNTLTSLLHKVYQNERSIVDSFDFDNVTNAFGTFFAEMFFTDHAALDKEVLLKKLFFQVGKWIYIIDAYDDFEKDIKKSRFNLLLSLSEKDKMEKAEAFEKALSIHLQLKQKIDTLLKELADIFYDECLINILTLGLDNVFYKITEKKYKDCLGRLAENGNGDLESLGQENRQ